MKTKPGYPWFIDGLSSDKSSRNFGIGKVKTQRGYPGFIYGLSTNKSSDTVGID